MASTLLPEIVTAVEQSHNADRVDFLKGRLLSLQEVLEENINQPVIAHYPFAAKVGGAQVHHLHGGLVTRPGLVYDTPQGAGISTRRNAFSTFYNNRLAEGYSSSGRIPLIIASLLFFHINDDNQEDRGFFIGEKACRDYLLSLPGRQPAFIEAAIL